MRPCNNNSDSCSDDCDDILGYPAPARIADSESFHAVALAGGTTTALLNSVGSGTGDNGVDGTNPAQMTAPLRGRLAQVTVRHDIATSSGPITIELELNGAVVLVMPVPAGVGPHVIDVPNLGSGFLRGSLRALRVRHSETTDATFVVGARWTFIVP